MKAERSQSVLWMIPLIVAASLINVPAQARYGGGTGTADDPYQMQMNAIGAEPNDWDKHFKLMADIDLGAYNGRAGSPAFVPIGTDGRPFTGVFDGAGKVISHLSCASADEYRVGLFGCVGTSGSIRNLGLEDATITSERCMQVGTIAGKNLGSITNCYSTRSVSGDRFVGGLIGATVRGIIQASFWDFESSTQTTSASGAGKTTAEMQTAKTFLDAGWDFVGETANGKEDIWWIDEGKDYPRLWWEAAAEPNSPAGGGNP